MIGPSIPSRSIEMNLSEAKSKNKKYCRIRRNQNNNSLYSSNSHEIIARFQKSSLLPAKAFNAANRVEAFGSSMPAR